MSVKSRKICVSQDDHRIKSTKQILMILVSFFSNKDNLLDKIKIWMILKLESTGNAPFCFSGTPCICDFAHLRDCWRNLLETSVPLLPTSCVCNQPLLFKQYEKSWCVTHKMVLFLSMYMYMAFVYSYPYLDCCDSLKLPVQNVHCVKSQVTWNVTCLIFELWFYSDLYLIVSMFSIVQII